MQDATDLPSTLILAGRPYPLDQLIEQPEPAVDAALTDNAHDTWRFCHQWLTGQHEFVVNTSGSTGPPKPITLTREQMIASARLTGATLGLHRGQHMLVCLPTRYIAGRMMLVRGFVLGLNMTIVEPASDAFAALPPQSHFDFAAFVPLQLQTLLAGPPHYHAILNGMQAILIGGGPVSPALHAQLQTIHAPVYHTYGMTETVTHVALRRLNGPDASATFTPLIGVKLGIDSRGCLHIRSEVTQNQTVQTNDLVDLQADGRFVWLGRWDNVINSGGVKVQVEKVERALEGVLYTLGLGTRRFFVGALPDDRLGETVTAVIEGAALDDNITTAVRDGLKQQVHPYEVPRRFYDVLHFIETPTGKIDRKANLLNITSMATEVAAT
ncbi:MAG: AMP-binding protein [Chloroflexota bacterium]|nr:AMP-binding protein [Chloroflexota bacterium]